MPSGIATTTYLSTKKIFVAENIFPDEFHGNYQFMETATELHKESQTDSIKVKKVQRFFAPTQLLIQGQ